MEFLLYWGGYVFLVFVPAVLATALTIHRFTSHLVPDEACRNNALALLKRLLIGVWFWLILLPFLPYLCVECQTMVARRWCETTIQRAVCATEGWQAPILQLKVLRLSSHHMQVYVVTKCRSLVSTGNGNQCAGMVYKLKWVHGQWVFTGDWEVIWSECGSAKGNVFPPYPDHL